MSHFLVILWTAKKAETTSCDSRLQSKDQRRNLQYRHQHHLQSRSLPVPRVCFREKRSAEDADMQERDEQTKAICDLCEESMGDVFDRDCEYPETDPISPAEGAAGRDADIKKMLTFHESPPQDAPHRDLPVITLVPRGPDGKVKCRIAMHGFKRWVLTDSRYAATPLRVTLRLRLGEAAERSWDVAFFDVTKAYWNTPRSKQQNRSVFVMPPPAWRSRNPGLVRKAHRVIPGDRRAQQLWQEHFNQCLSNLVFVTCTADPTPNAHQEREVRISTRVDDGCASGPPPALPRAACH